MAETRWQRLKRLDPAAYARQLELNRARKKKYGGRCVDCGRPTSHRGGKWKEGPALRCRYCARGIAPPPPDNRRRVPVRLTEIALDDRLDAAQEAIRWEDDLDERALILLAAVNPSDTVYWIAA